MVDRANKTMLLLLHAKTRGYTMGDAGARDYLGAPRYGASGKKCKGYSKSCKSSSVVVMRMVSALLFRCKRACVRGIFLYNYVK